MTDAELFPREQAKQLLQSLGAIVGNSSTKDTDVLILGTDPGRVKLERAKQLGIPVIPWAQFVALGFMEQRAENRTKLDLDLLTTIAIQMGVIANAIFSHLATSRRNSQRANSLWLAYACAYHGVDYFLRGAWGESVELERADRQRSEASEHQLKPRACFVRSRLAWEGAAIYLERAVMFTE
jgi:hypothetical protein